MRKLLQAVVATAILTIGTQVGAAEVATRDEAVTLVKKLVKAAKADGKEVVIKDVNTPSGKYQEKDIYVTIETIDGLALANNTAQRMVGKNLLELRDPDGKFFVKERNEALKAKPVLWTEVKWPNPVSGKNDTKLVYSERVDNLIFSAGVQKP